MTAWSTISDRTAGQTITASWANTLRDNALHLYQIVGAGASAWTSYAPTFGSAVTVGNGTATGGYQQVGKLVHFRAKFVLGTTSSIGANPVTVTLPVTGSAGLPMGQATIHYYDDSAAKMFLGLAVFTSTTVVTGYYMNTSTFNARGDSLSSTAPFTWTNPDYIQVAGWYEAA